MSAACASPSAARRSSIRPSCACSGCARWLTWTITSAARAVATSSKTSKRTRSNIARMGTFLSDLVHSNALIAAVFGWLVAQLLKTLLALFRDRKLDLGYMVSPGGMPSAHSALVTALATAIARLYGVQSSIFALAAVFAGVVM